MQQTSSLFVFIIYFFIIYGIGYVAKRKTKNTRDYLLGSRRFNPYVTALAAGASDMGSWLLMGLPGAVYLSGLNQIWMPIGLLLGAYANWRWVATPLRIASAQAQNAVTIPSYLAVRFKDQANRIALTVAGVCLFFFTVYVAAGFVSFAWLLQYLYTLSYTPALCLAVGLTTVYVLVGGFVAVTWVDVGQGLCMLGALLALPALMWYKLDEPMATLQPLKSHFLHPLADVSGVQLLSLVGWGLGYFGQPHILVRFMAIQEADQMHRARWLNLVWMFLCLLGAVAVGLLGALLFALPAHPEEIFIVAAYGLYTPILASIVVTALLSAIMSTISAQLLVAASALVEDLGLRWWAHYKAQRFTPRWRLRANRVAVVFVALGAAGIALYANTRILSLVAYAWAGLGATLGPVLLFALYWPTTTSTGALVGMSLGAITVMGWPFLQGYGGIFELYAMIPGFCLASLGIVGASLLK